MLGVRLKIAPTFVFVFFFFQLGNFLPENNQLPKFYNISRGYMRI